MVGGDDAHDAVANRRQQGLPIGLGPQRRVHLRVRAVLPDGLMRQRQVVRRGLRGRPLGPVPQQLNAGGRGEVRDVQRRPAGPLPRLAPLLQRPHLRLRMLAGHAKLTRQRTVVHHPAGGERFVLGMSDEDQPQLSAAQQGLTSLSEGAQHERVVADRDAAGIAQGREVRERLAVIAAGRGADDAHPAPRRAPDARADLPHVVRGVGCRAGVGHCADGCEAAADGRARPALDRLLLLGAGLAQVHVQVNQPGADDLPGGVYHLRVA